MESCGKINKAKEEQTISQYREEINLIIAEEVAERKTEAKKEQMIDSLDSKINEKEWVKQTSKEKKEEETTVEYLIVESMEGYEFIIEVDNKKETAKIVGENRTLGEKYTITYCSNDETDASKTIEVRKGFSTILGGEDTFSREYYLFAGWYEKEQLEEGTIAYLAGSSYTPKEDVTLYAIWTNNATTISFDSNGGTGNMASVKITKGGTAKLPVNGFEKVGYQFVKWNTKADGTGVDYEKLGSITVGAEDTITLYAIWEIAPAKVGEKVIISKKDNYTDKDGETATVPAGFAIVPGCSDISEGLVISDVANDTANEGNQFVWIPVDNINNFKLIEGYSNDLLQSMITNCTEPFANGYSAEKTEYDTMKKSVEINKGFYIGRFEAGKDSSGNVVVKKGADVYSNVPWGNSMSDIEGTSQTGGKVGAVKLSKEFATRNEYQGVTSTLCYGVQWDATMQFIDSNYISGTCKAESYVRNSIGRGHYEADSPTTTGFKPEYAEKNIYDMAGNVREWTMEAYNTNNRVARGGNHKKDAFYGPTSSRGNANPDTYEERRGFRIALYLSN